MQYIDKKQLATIVLAAVVIFFLQKYLTKVTHKADGTVVAKVGFDGLGHI